LSSRLVFALFWASTATLANAEPSTAGAPDAARQKELVRLVRQDCGSCHGMTLRGGLGPALLPENLRDKPAEGLAATIYYADARARRCRRGSSSCRKPRRLDRATIDDRFPAVRI
jgi:mono/diheme cytochrome c family protein